MIDQLLTSTALAAIEQATQYDAFLSFIVASLFGRPKAPPAPPPVPVPTPAPAPQIVKVVETKTTPNLQEAVESAKAAGFNPSTAAAYGLLQGFTTQETPFLTTNPKYVTWQSTQDYNTQNYNRTLQIQQDRFNYEQQKRQWISQTITGLSNIATGLATGGSTRITQGLQNDLLRSEIFRNNSLGYKNTSGFHPVTAGAKTEYYNPIKSTQPERQKGQNLFGFDNFNDYNVPTQSVEDEYGEVISWPYGAFKLGGDLYGHYFGASNDNRSLSNVGNSVGGYSSYRNGRLPHTSVTPTLQPHQATSGGW
jgi:hypothetical protein